VQLHRDRDKFEEAGTRLVVIGMGTSAHAKEFQRTQKVDLEMLVDPGREAYAAAGTKIATFSELLGPRVVAKGAQTTAKLGVRQGRTVGHPAQLGGVLVVAQDGSVPYAHLSDDASDNPSNDEVLAAANEAAGRGRS
jgi:prostamide/prostaglandin F2alpha synthase